MERSPYLPERKKRHRRGKRGGRKQRERMLAKLAPKPEIVHALRSRLALLRTSA